MATAITRIPIRVNAINKIIGSEEFQKLQELGLARIEYERFEYVDMATGPVFISDGIFGKPSIQIERRVYARSPVRFSLRDVSRVKAKRSSKREVCKQSYVVVQISPAKLALLGLNTTTLVSSIIAGPLLPIIIASTAGFLFNLNGLVSGFSISRDMAFFYSYLQFIDLKKKQITSKEEFKKLFDEDFKKVMKNQFPDIKLENDFDFVFDGLFNRSMIINKKGYYAIRKTITIKFFNYSFK